MNVCEALLDILADYGVKYIFGIPGDSINELIEAIRKQERIKFIHVMHEESGAFAASAQAKLTGELCACCGTSGPGSIHLLNGLYDAKMDHAPVIAITGQIETSLLGTQQQQEINSNLLFNDVALFNQTIISADQMPEIASLACQTALAKKGVAHISIPSNIAVHKVRGLKEKKQIIKTFTRAIPHINELQTAAEYIENSDRPCILAGIGAKEAAKELVKFAEHIQAPIIKSLRGKDLIADDHPFTLGGTGMLGTEPSYHATMHCDLLIVIGSDLPYTDFYPEAEIPTIQIDIDTAHIGRRHRVTVPLAGDAGPTLNELMQLTEKKTDTSFIEECRDEMRKWINKEKTDEESTDIPLKPQAAARMLSELADENAVICCDTGLITVWSARNFKIKTSQRFIISGGLASMAFALPAAIGAQLLYPEKEIIAICGDGGFAMLMADFATAVKYQLPIKVFIFNNGKLGMIKAEQEIKAGNPEYETDLLNPDYTEFAKICGGEGYSAETPEELADVISIALKSPLPCIVNVFINPDEISWPPNEKNSDKVNFIKAKTKELFIKE